MAGRQAMSRAGPWLLVVFNAVVLLGQLWPAGAPPFARAVNIGFLAVQLAVNAWALTRSHRSRG